MMLYCRYQAFLFDLNLVSLPNDDIPSAQCSPVLFSSVSLCSTLLGSNFVHCYTTLHNSTYAHLFSASLIWSGVAANKLRVSCINLLSQISGVIVSLL